MPDAPIGQADNELNAVDTWLYQELSSIDRVQQLVGKHPTEGMWQVYESAAIQGATYPMVVSKFKTGVYRLGAESRKIFLKATYDILAYTQKPTYSAVAELSGIIIGTLHRDQLTSTDTVIAGCRCLAPLKGEHTLDGVTSKYLGGKFEIMAYVLNRSISPPENTGLIILPMSPVVAPGGTVQLSVID